MVNKKINRVYKLYELKINMCHTKYPCIESEVVYLNVSLVEETIQSCETFKYEYLKSTIYRNSTWLRGIVSWK